MNMDSAIPRGIPLRTLATILKSPKLMSELQDKAWSQMEHCGGRTSGPRMRELIPLCSAFRVCNVHYMDDS